MQLKKVRNGGVAKAEVVHLLCGAIDIGNLNIKNGFSVFRKSINFIS